VNPKLAPRTRALLCLAPLAAAACVLPQTYEAVVARNRALENDREQMLRRLAEIEGQVVDGSRAQAQLKESQASLEAERAALLERYEDLRTGTEGLRDELERERTERLAKEEQIQAMTGTYKNLVDELENEVRDGQIEVQRLQGRLQVRALEKILFDSGKAELKPEGRKVLKRVAEQVKKLPGHSIRIEGHTDDVPISTARFPSNWELSAARATGVVREFIDDGLPPERLSAVGRGEFAPIEENSSAEKRARNRRIEIILIPDGDTRG
jgi:chemotaxis protein MotB